MRTNSLHGAPQVSINILVFLTPFLMMITENARHSVEDEILYLTDSDKGNSSSQCESRSTVISNHYLRII